MATAALTTSLSNFHQNFEDLFTKMSLYLTDDALGFGISLRLWFICISPRFQQPQINQAYGVKWRDHGRQLTSEFVCQFGLEIVATMNQLFHARCGKCRCAETTFRPEPCRPIQITRTPI